MVIRGLKYLKLPSSSICLPDHSKFRSGNELCTTAINFTLAALENAWTILTLGTSCPLTSKYTDALALISRLKYFSVSAQLLNNKTMDRRVRKFFSFIESMSAHRSHQTDWTLMVKISQKQTPVGWIQGGFPLSRVKTNRVDDDDDASKTSANSTTSLPIEPSAHQFCAAARAQVVLRRVFIEKSRRQERICCFVRKINNKPL